MSAFILVRDEDRARVLVRGNEAAGEPWTARRWHEDSDAPSETIVVGTTDDEARRFILALLRDGFRNGL